MLMDRWLLILTIPSVVERNFRHGNTSVSFQLVGSAATRELPASAVEGNPRALVGSAATRELPASAVEGNPPSAPWRES